MYQSYLKTTKMPSTFDFLFATLASMIFIEAKVLIIPNDSGRVNNNFSPQVPPMIQGNPFYPQMAPQPTMQSSQPIPQFMSDPSNINGVNSRVFPQQMTPMIQGNAFNPYMTSQQLVPINNNLPPLMLDPIMQGYQHQNHVQVMPIPIPLPIDSFSQQIAFLIQSGIARLRTYVDFANRYIPNYSYNGPIISNMSPAVHYPNPYVQQIQPKIESQEVLGEGMLDQQLQNANEQQQIIENDQRERDEYEAEMANERSIQLEEEEEIEKEKREAEERIKQEQREEKERQDLEKKLREEQELRLKQIEEEEKSRKKKINNVTVISSQRQRPQRSNKSLKQKQSEAQLPKQVDRQDSEATNNKRPIKTLSMNSIKPKTNALKQTKS